MTVKELAELSGMQAFLLPDGQREIQGGYAGDLLSWVMGRAQADCVWVTIMSNRNVAAVAQLTDVACVVLAEGVLPDPELLTACTQHSINLLGAEADTYTVCTRIGSR